MKKKELSGLVADMRRCFDSGNSLRFHIQHYRNGMGCRVRAWHPDGHVIATVGGCGFDREGTALGYVLEMFFGTEIQKLPVPERDQPIDRDSLYGLFATGGGTKHLDGGCGWNSMVEIAKAMYLDVERFDTGKLSTIVFIRPGHGYTSEVEV